MGAVYWVVTASNGISVDYLKVFICLYDHIPIGTYMCLGYSLFSSLRAFVVEFNCQALGTFFKFEGVWGLVPCSSSVGS